VRGREVERDRCFLRLLPMFLPRAGWHMRVTFLERAGYRHHAPSDSPPFVASANRLRLFPRYWHVLFRAEQEMYNSAGMA